MARLWWAAVIATCATVLFCAPPAAAGAGAFDLEAHRGGRGETTEESLQAFAKSLELGVTTLELDIVLSKDAAPMVWHDPVIEPAKCADTGPAFAGDPQYPYVGKPVHELTSTELHTLDCGLGLKEFPGAEVVVGNRIATLPDVLALADAYGASVRYNIETKVEAEHPELSAPPAEFVDVILGTIRRAGKTDFVQIQSFDWRTLPMVRRAEPRIPLVALWDETTWFTGSPWLDGYDAGSGDPIAGAISVGADVLSPGYSVPYGQTPADRDFRLIADKPFIDRAHSLGLTVIPWTINDAATMNAQIDAGADGIITDYPSLLRRVMTERGMSLPVRYTKTA